MQLKPTITGGDSKSVEYTSSAPGVVGVDSDGYIYALANGKATITCAATDGSNKKAKCNVIVSVPMSRVTIVPKNANEGIVSVGSTITLSAKVSNNFGKAANQKVKWSVVSGSEYITVDENKGTVKAVNCVITNNRYPQAYVKAEAMDGSGVSAVYSVMILPKVTKLNTNNSKQDVLLFQPSVEYEGGQEFLAPSYSVDISGGKDIGYQNDQDTGEFWLVPKWTTTGRTLAQIIASGGMVLSSEVQKVTVTVTLKDGSNKKKTETVEYVLTKDGYIIGVEAAKSKDSKTVYTVTAQ